MSKLHKISALSAALMLLTAALWAAPAHIMLGSREILGVWDGKTVWAPTTILTEVDAANINIKSDKATFTTASGKHVEIPLKSVDGKKMVAANDVFNKVGARTAWNKGTSTYTANALLKSVGYDKDVLTVNLTFPAQTKVTYWESGKKIILDFVGVKNDGAADTVHIGEGNIIQARVGQQDESTARVVVDLKDKIPYSLVGESRDSKIKLAMGPNASKIAAAAAPKAEPASNLLAETISAAKAPSVNSFNNKEKEEDLKLQTQPFRIYRGFIDPLNPSAFNLVFTCSGEGTAEVEANENRTQVTVKFPKGSVPSDMKNITGSHGFVSGYVVNGDTVTILTNRQVMVSQPIATSASIMIKIGTAEVGGKTVVIEPGHGGKDTGAVGNGLQEKTINLQIAKALAEELEKMGVHAVLTRTRDAEMGLYARPDVAINKNADFFNSIHCNSNTSRNSATGVETYYHMNRRDCRELAKMIQNRICSYTGMTDKGARSDKSRYGIGLAVLRRLNTSSIPGVLIECGYINNSSDAAKLQNPDYQQTLARAVADAIKAYTGSVSE